MKYKVQGSWDGIEWWYNNIPRTCSPDFETTDLEHAIKFTEQFLETRPFKHRRIVDEQMNVIWSYSP